MDIFEKICFIVKMNEGSSLVYNQKTQQYVVSAKKGRDFIIPGDCEMKNDHITKEITGNIVCQVFFE